MGGVTDTVTSKRVKGKLTAVTTEAPLSLASHFSSLPFEKHPLPVCLGAENSQHKQPSSFLTKSWKAREFQEHTAGFASPILLCENTATASRACLVGWSRSSRLLPSFALSSSPLLSLSQAHALSLPAPIFSLPSHLSPFLSPCNLLSISLLLQTFPTCGIFSFPFVCGSPLPPPHFPYSRWSVQDREPRSKGVRGMEWLERKVTREKTQCGLPCNRTCRVAHSSLQRCVLPETLQTEKGVSRAETHTH